MILWAPICLADSTPSKPTAPSPTTTTVESGFTFAASAANHPVPITSESANKLGTISPEGTSGVHQGAVSEWHPQQRCLRRADELRVLARGLITDLAVGAGVVGGEERSDDELTRLAGGDCAADLLNDAAVLVSHRRRLGNRLDAAIRPQVRPADTRGRDPDDGICRLDDLRRFALLETHISRPVKNSSSHCLSPFLQRLMKPPSTEMD